MARSKTSSTDGKLPADELSGEMALRASLDNRGLTVGGKSRFLAATDQLLGGLVGIPGAWAEDIRARQASRGRHRLAMQELDQTLEFEGKRARIEHERVALELIVSDGVRKLENRNAVWQAADEELLAKVLPTEEASAETVEASAEEANLFQDWMNHFTPYAEKASSDTVRTLWGRILAGEIRKQGAFSLPTLRVLSEVDAVAASSFQQLAKLRIAPDQLLTPPVIQGEILMELLVLEELGLILNGNAPLHLRVGQAVPVFVQIIGNRVLHLIDAQADQITWQIIKITRAGRQIAEILPWDCDASARQLANRLGGDFSIELREVVTEPDLDASQIWTRPIEMLRSKPSAAKS